MTLIEVLTAFNPATIDQNLPLSTFNETIRESVAQNAAIFKDHTEVFNVVYGAEFTGINPLVFHIILNYIKNSEDNDCYYLTEKPECSWLKDITILSVRTKEEDSYKHVFLSSTDKVYLMSELAFPAVSDDSASLMQRVEESGAAVPLKAFLNWLGLLEVYPEEEHLTLPDLEVYDDTTLRFRSADWFNVVQSMEITLVGVGGIGSHTALMLSRFHPASMFLYDPDKVEAVNMAGQWYSKEDIGNFKVNACYRNMGRFSDYYSVVCHSRMFTKSSKASQIMICGLDNMEARKDCFKSWLRTVADNEEQAGNCLFIDGRLAAEELQVFCIRGDMKYDIERYKEKYLFPSSEAEETSCSYKQTAYMANMIAGVICNLVANFGTNKLIPDYRSLPFLTTYNGYTMSFKSIE